MAVQPKMRSGVGIALLFARNWLLEQDLGLTAQPERNRKTQHQHAERDFERRQDDGCGQPKLLERNDDPDGKSRARAARR